MNWHIGEYDPVANFTYVLSGANQLTFSNTSSNANAFLWRFGDGDTSSAVNPVHTYSSPGLYDVTLVSAKCGRSDSATQTISVTATGLAAVADPGEQWMVYPIPASTSLLLQTTILGPMNYTMFNAAGTAVQHNVITGSSKNIDLSTLPGGSVFYSVASGKQVLRMPQIQQNTGLGQAPSEYQFLLFLF